MKHLLLSTIIAILAIANVNAQEVYSLSSSGNLPLTLDFPDIKNNIVFTADVPVTVMGDLIIERSNQRWAGTTLTITPTTVSVKFGDASVATKTHGLVINKNLRITLNIANTDLAKSELSMLTLMSDGKMVSMPIPFNGVRDGFVLKAGSGVYGEAKCQAYTREMCHSIWAYGDSYFDLWPLLAYSDGVDIMFDGFSGRVSTQALSSLKKELKFATPTTIFWCMGMNDHDGATINNDWINTVHELEAICKEKNVRLVMQTIPNVPNNNNSLKNNYIKESGLDYVDINQAVGADVNPNWNAGLLQSDQVHPTAEGAEVIRQTVVAYFKGEQTGGGNNDNDLIKFEGGVYQVNIDNTCTLASADGNSLTTFCVPAEVNGMPVTYISDNAFNGITTLKTLTFAEGCNIEEIGARAFMATGITALDLTPCTKLTTIYERAFCNCAGLTSVTFNKSLKKFSGESQFNGCTSLAEVVFPDGCQLQNISAFAFENAKKFRTIRIPATVTTIGKEAFGWGGADSKLETVIFEEGSKLVQIGELAFRNCQNLKSINLNECKELTTILWDVFYGCSKLESADIDQCAKLERLEGSVFRGTNIKSVVIPASVKLVSGCCFNECPNLTSVTCMAPEPPTAYDNTFGGNTFATTLYVAAGSRAKYSIATGWKSFKKIEEINQ